MRLEGWGIQRELVGEERQSSGEFTAATASAAMTANAMVSAVIIWWAAYPHEWGRYTALVYRMCASTLGPLITVVHPYQHLSCYQSLEPLVDGVSAYTRV